MGECDILWVPFVWGDLAIIHHPVRERRKKHKYSKIPGAPRRFCLARAIVNIVLYCTIYSVCKKNGVSCKKNGVLL